MSSAQDQPAQEATRPQKSAWPSVPRPAPHYEGKAAHAAGPSAGQRSMTFAAAVLLVVSGAFNILEGLAAIIRSSFFGELPNYAYNISVRGWGWFHLIMGIVVFLTGCFLFVDSMIARVTGVVIAAISAMVNFLFIPYSPVWSVVLIAIDALIIWALASPRRDWA